MIERRSLNNITIGIFMVSGLFDALSSGFGSVTDNIYKYFGNQVDPKNSETETPTVIEDTITEETDSNTSDKKNNSKASDKTSNVAATKVYQPLPLDASLTAHIDALRMDALYTADLKATRAYEEMEKLRGQVTLLTDTIQAIVESSDTDSGTLDITDNLNLQESFKQLKEELGIQIPDNKTNFTKDERDNLIKRIERKEKVIDIDLKQSMQKVSESIKERNEWYQELKALYDKHDRIISMILSFIKQSTR